MKKWMENSLSKADRCSSIAKIMQSHERKGVVLNIHITSTFFLMVLAGLIATIPIFGAEIFKGRMITSKKENVTLQTRRRYKTRKIAWILNDHSQKDLTR